MPYCKNCGARITKFEKDICPVCGQKKPLEGASRILGRNLTKGSIVVFESTVYPGVTEEVCIPILEEESGLKCGIDFKVGYSPERISPGDKVHRLSNIKKIVSGSDEEALSIITDLYNLVVEVGVHPVSDMKTPPAHLRVFQLKRLSFFLRIYLKPNRFFLRSIYIYSIKKHIL